MFLRSRGPEESGPFANAQRYEQQCVLIPERRDPGIFKWNENQTIGIKLLSDDGDQSWARLIPLSRAEFMLLQMGDPEFEHFAKSRFHSVLVFRFPDATTMFLAEQVTSAQSPSAGEPCFGSISVIRSMEYGLSKDSGFLSRFSAEAACSGGGQAAFAFRHKR